MGKIYNEDIKNRFLTTYDNDQTKITLKNVFFRTNLIEEVLEKDLFNFNLTELGKAIENTNPHTVVVARSTSRFISQYISWAIENGYRANNINPLKGIDHKWFSQLVDHTKKIHYSYEEFINLLENMQNGQDQAFLFLIFEGVMGQSFSQLRSLKFSDVNWDTNEVFIKERNMNVKVSEECMKYLQKAYNQTTYFYYHVEKKDHNEKDLLSSEYIFKNIYSPRATEGQMVNPTVFYTRLSLLKAEFELEYLTPNAIKQSGMIKLAVDLFEEYGILTYEQLEIIGKKYDWSTLVNNGYEYFNTNMMKEFINHDNIKDLYNVDVKFK